MQALAGVDGVDVATGQMTTESYEQAHIMFEEAGGVDKLEQVQVRLYYVLCVIVQCESALFAVE